LSRNSKTAARGTGAINLKIRIKSRMGLRPGLKFKGFIGIAFLVSELQRGLEIKGALQL